MPAGRQRVAAFHVQDGQLTSGVGILRVQPQGGPQRLPRLAAAAQRGQRDAERHMVVGVPRCQGDGGPRGPFRVRWVVPGGQHEPSVDVVQERLVRFGAHRAVPDGHRLVVPAQAAQRQPGQGEEVADPRRQPDCRPGRSTGAPRAGLGKPPRRHADWQAGRPSSPGTCRHRVLRHEVKAARHRHIASGYAQPDVDTSVQM